MEKRIVIAGCRYFNDYELAKTTIEDCLSNISKEDDIIILSGGCSGADLLGERYARQMGYKIERHPANWEKYGKAAGQKRNEEMAKRCDFVICFWDNKSKGTKGMIQFAKKYNKPTTIKII